MISMWLSSLITTFFLVVIVNFISLFIGFSTAVLAWASNKKWAYYIPILFLSVPPWVFSYYLSSLFIYINPWIGSSISLGVCCSVYAHSIFVSSLSNRAYKNWEMLKLFQGNNLKSLWTAIYPSLRLSLFPCIALISAEVITDFGVCNFFGINSITMMIFNIWTSTWNFSLLTHGLFILLLLGISVSLFNSNQSIKLNSVGFSNENTILGFFSILPTITLLGFCLGVNLNWLLTDIHSYSFLSVWSELFNSLTLIFFVVCICLIIVFFYISGIGKRFLFKIGLLMYSIPGAVIGACILWIFGGTFNLFSLLIFSLCLRYFGLMVHSISVSDRGNIQYFEVIDLSSSNNIKRFFYKVRLMFPNIMIGICLVVLDVLKELPISMILQPMNFETLAMRMNYISVTDYLPDLALHSIILVALGMIFCIIAMRLNYVRDRSGL